MNLAKTTVLNGIAVLVKIATNLALNKIFAVAIGPSGYAVIGQFQNLIAVVNAVTSGILTTGTTKYTAQHANDRTLQATFWQAAMTLNFVAGLLCAGVLLMFRRPLAEWALASADLSYTVVWLAGAVFFSSLNALLLAILNGLKLVRVYVVANIVGSLLTAIVAAVLVSMSGLQGALIALTVSPAVAILFTGTLFFRHAGVSVNHLIGRLHASKAKLLANFAIIGLASSILSPISQTFAREGVTRALGLHEAGLWQALVRISDMHLMLLTTTLSVYLLPRLSEIRFRDEFQREIRKGQTFIVPLVTGTALAIWLSRNWLVQTLLSPAFMPLIDVVGIQVLGDIVKISTFIFAYTLISKAKTRAYLFTELLFSVVNPVIITAGAFLWGLKGTAIAYIGNYLLYWFVNWALYRQVLKTDFDVSSSPIGPKSSVLLT